MNYTRLLSALAAFVAIAFGHATYTGYSGAPGTGGTCSGQCHGSSGGSIAVRGFPASYTPGQAYTISVVHTSGSSVNNFNASVRQGTGSTNAGTIAAGYRTAVYNTSGETNGVHLSSTNKDSCTFIWTAPSPGVGNVKLYLAGHQGSSAGGANTVVTAVSTQGAGIAENRPIPGRNPSLTVRPTIITNKARIQVDAAVGTGLRLFVLDRTGRVVGRIPAPAADVTMEWAPVDRSGRRLAAGSYVLVAMGNGLRVTRHLTIR
jgi:hypothetical protein